MNNYISLDHAPDIKFIVPNNESLSSVKIFAFVLDSLVILYEEFFDLGSQQLTVQLMPNDPDSPQCFRDLKFITLDTELSRWSQAAYQLAHELCHLMIPSNVTADLRWLEESICETASYFFLRRLTLLWQENNVSLFQSDGSPYAPAFTEYVIDDSQKADPFILTDKDIHDLLKQECYLRGKNKHIANALLPIFTRIPILWASVPKLCFIPSGLTLQDSLDYWLHISPEECQSGIEEIIGLFLPCS